MSSTRPQPLRRRSTTGSAGLVQALRASDADRIKAIIDNATFSGEREDLLAQALSVACECDQLALVEELTLLGADPKKKFGSRVPPLLTAVTHDHQDIVLHLLEKYSLIYASDVGKHPPDSEAARKVVALRRDLQRTALALAKLRGVVELLINDGADILSVGNEGKTLLMDVRNPAVAELLIDKGARIDSRDDQNNTALMRAIVLDEDPKERIAKLLIERGSKTDIEARDKKGRTILMTAVWKSRIDVINSLIDKGVALNAIDKEEQNALHLLASDHRRTYEYRPDRQRKRNS